MSDDMLDNHSIDSGISMGDPNAKPFVADAIIANPPSFAHIHVAEKLGVPLHLMFTMPWSPTQSFPHPLANIVSSNADAAMTNFLSYILVDLLTWQGIGDVINRFREKTLRLEPLSVIWAPGNLHRLRIPWTYCWSPALIPKPADWQNYIDISGFYFLNLASNYTPAPDLAEFLDAGPPPVYIGFGSIVVDDPNAMTKLIFEAVKKTGQRALVSKGWGGLSGDEMGVPDGVFMLGNCPHDWLFKRVSCVVHHGGAGTTAAGIAAGRPTIIVPFFGDQAFWGAMCQRAGAGPDPIPHKELTADRLAEAITFALKPDVLERAKEMSEKIKEEKGTEAGADSFHRHLMLPKMRCSLCPGRVAVWEYRKSGIRLSALAATVLANEGLLKFSDLRIYRSCEYTPDTGPPEPISGGAAALLGTIGAITSGVADYPSEVLKSFKKGSNKPRDSTEGSPGPARVKSPTESTCPIDAAKAKFRRHSSRDSQNIQNTSASSSASILTASELSATSSSTSLPTSGEHRQLSRGPTPSHSRAPSGYFPSTPSRSGTETNLTAVSSRPISEEPGSTTPSGVTTSVEPDNHSLHSHSSGNSSHHDSGANTPKGQDPFCRAGQITKDSMLGTARATGNIVVAGLKSPVDFTMSIAQGFHNAPKLYGDKTVRPTEKVTGFHSGIKAAGKEFGYGIYDGLAGLVKQPIQGAKEEGIVGLGKGIFKGSMGVFLKPGAAMWGLPGYAMKGIYVEIVKNFGKSTHNFIIAARTAQGYEEWKSSSEGERERIVTVWNSDIMQARATSKWWGTRQRIDESNDRRFYGDDGELLKGFRATRHLSHDDKRILAKLRKDQEKKEKGKERVTEVEIEPTPTPPAMPRSVASPGPPERPQSLAGTTDEEFEQAIRIAVQQTSNNDPEEDARIERAIRASVREFQRRMSTGPGQPNHVENEDEVYNRALEASRTEYSRRSVHPALREEPEEETVNITLANENEDEDFTKALAASLEEARRAEAERLAHDSALGSEVGDEDDELVAAIEASKRDTSHGFQDNDEDYRRAIEESQKVHPLLSARPLAAGSSSGPADPPPDYEARAPQLRSPPIEEHSGRRLSELDAGPETERPSLPDRPDRKPQLPERSYKSMEAMVSSPNLPIPVTQSSEAGPEQPNDEEYERVLKASEEAAKQHELELQKALEEEAIVLEYVKRQSLREEEYRRRVQNEQ